MCRFTPEEKAKRHPCAYMPFGYGPRNCIGMRFALLEVKMALIEIVSKFRMALSPETKVRIVLTVKLTCTYSVMVLLSLVHSDGGIHVTKYTHNNYCANKFSITIIVDLLSVCRHYHVSCR